MSAAGQESYEHEPLRLFEPHIPGIGAKEAGVLNAFLNWELRKDEYPNSTNAALPAAYGHYGGESARMSLLEVLGVSVQKPHALARTLAESEKNARGCIFKAAQNARQRQRQSPLKDQVDGLIGHYPTEVDCTLNPIARWRRWRHAPRDLLLKAILARDLSLQERISTTPERSTAYFNREGEVAFKTHDLQVVGEARKAILKDPDYITARRKSENVVSGNGPTVESLLTGNRRIAALIGYLAASQLLPGTKHKIVQ